VRASAAVLRDSIEKFVVQEVELAPLRADEVLVGLVATGVCHTDLTCRTGFAATPRPVVLGHEGAGQVLEIGPGVTDLVPGDHVVLTYWSCGACRHCLAGNDAYCTQFSVGNLSGLRPDRSTPLTSDGTPVGGHFFGQSSFATHCVATQRNAVRVPVDAPLDILAPLGCGALTGAGTILNVLRPERRARLLVTGAGGVGLSAVMAGAVLGLAEIIVVEPRPHRRSLALSVGATRAISPEEFSAVEPGAFDCAVDTTGVLDVIEHIGELVAPRGQVALLTAQNPDARLPLRLLSSLRTGATFRGVRLGGGDRELIPQLAALYAAGSFPLDKIVTSYPFEDIENAMAAAESGAVVKPVLTFRPE
jgi:aryl-alcohol dehydrogenase